MTPRLLVAWFDREAPLFEAVRHARSHGWRILDTHTPYAVHGLDRACGLRRSRLPYVCLALGLTGAAAKLWFQIWTSANSWPLDVGGKPFASVPAFVPVTFEITVLFAGIGTVITFLLRSRLRPGRRPGRLPERVTDDRFALVLEQRDASVVPAQAMHDLRALGAVRVEDVSSDAARRGDASVGMLGPAHPSVTGSTPPSAAPADHSPDQRTAGITPAGGTRGLAVVNLILGALLLAVVAGIIVLQARPDQRAVEVLPGMFFPVPAEAFEASAAFPDGMTLREPPAGTLPAGAPPRLPYTAAPDDAVRAGAELVTPFAATDAAALARGAEAYATWCSPCHGGEGAGDGGAAQRGAPRPPSLHSDRALAMSDGQMYHIQTYGQNLMPSHAAQVSHDDRWRIVLHIRALQARARAAAAPAASAAPAAAPAAPAASDGSTATDGGAR